MTTPNKNEKPRKRIHLNTTVSEETVRLIAKHKPDHEYSAGRVLDAAMAKFKGASK